MLVVVSRQRIEDFALPARCNSGIQQTVSRLNKTMLLDQRTHAVTVELTRPGEVGNIYRSTRQVQRQSVTITLCVFQRRQPLQIFRLTLPATRRIERDHARTGQRRASRNITQHQTVVIGEPEWCIKHQFRQRPFEQGNTPGDVAGRVVNMQRLPLHQRRGMF